MTMLEWAKREVEIACKKERGNAPEDEWDYGCGCYESALKAFETLCGEGHSGFSMGLTRDILNRLIDGKPLTPIEDTGDIWYDVDDYSESKGYMQYQCKRMSSLFKEVYPDGRVKYVDVNRIVCVDPDNPHVWWHNGFVKKLIEEMFPLTMPYSGNELYKVYKLDFLTDRKNGDFDTIGILFVVDSTGEITQINRYFKYDGDGWIEIGGDEYIERKMMHIQREAKESED